MPLESLWRGSWSALGSLRSQNKEVGNGSWPSWAQKGCQNESQNGSQKRSKMPLGAQEAPRGCQGAMLDPFWSPLGSIPTRFWEFFCMMLDSLQISEHVFWFSFKLYSSTSTSGMLSARWPVAGASQRYAERKRAERHPATLQNSGLAKLRWAGHRRACAN